jgi:chromosome segregation ATPase
MPPRTKTIRQLRSELETKERRLRSLRARRRRAASNLAAMDREIAALEGSGRGRRAAPSRKKVKKTRKAKKAKARGKAKRTTKATRKVRRARRRATGKPLADYLYDVLKGGQPMRVKEAVQAVQRAGYRSSSRDFYKIVATALRKDPRFTKVSRGVYKTK